jgi:hypothetical protein
MTLKTEGILERALSLNQVEYITLAMLNPHHLTKISSQSHEVTYFHLIKAKSFFFPSNTRLLARNLFPGLTAMRDSNLVRPVTQCSAISSPHPLMPENSDM